MMGKVPEIPKEPCKDRFLVQSYQYEGEENEDKFEWKTYFSTSNPIFEDGVPAPTEKKLKCSYILPTDSEPQTNTARPAATAAPEDGSTLTKRNTSSTAKQTPPAATPSPSKTTPGQASTTKPTEKSGTK